MLGMPCNKAHFHGSVDICSTYFLVVTFSEESEDCIEFQFTNTKRETESVAAVVHLLFIHGMQPFFVKHSTVIP